MSATSSIDLSSNLASISPQVFPWQAEQWNFWQSQIGRHGHAYLLAGTAGLGLVEFAKTLAQSLLCVAENAPCKQCKACHQVANDLHPDLILLDILEGKKEVGIDQIRDLTADLMQTSHQGGYKVAILPEVEHLNTSAFNALLKTLEEPPAKTLLVLTTHQIKLLPATIISRCLKIDFIAPEIAQSQAWLQAQGSFSPELINRSLQLNWSAPMAALRWLQAENWQQDEAWKQDMAAVSNGSKTISEAVAAWLKWEEPEQVLNQFYRLSVQKIRAEVYKAQTNPKHWFAFQQAVLQAQQDWRQNANKELLLESLGLQCLQAIQAARN